MSRRWNGKALIDELDARLWGNSNTTFREKIIGWVNEIQDDIASREPLDYYRIKLKKLLPVTQEDISLQPQVPSTPTVALTSSTVSQDINSAETLVFDSTLIESDADSAQLVTQIDADETAFQDFGQTNLLRVAGGSAAGTLAGTAAITAGQLVMSGTGNYFWDLTSQYGADADIGCIRFKYIPTYTGSPAATQTIYYEQESSSVTRSQILITHGTDGGVKVSLIDGSGGTVVSNQVMKASWSPTDGTSYEFEYNFTTGAQYFFIDGVLEYTGAYTHSRSTLAYARSGLSNNDYKLDDIQRFSAVKHTTAFTGEIPRTVPLVAFVSTSPTITTPDLGIKSIDSFVATTVVAGSDLVKYTYVVDDQEKYWDGSAWVNANGTYAQSNTEAEMLANSATLTAALNTLKVRIYLYSDDGSTTPEISNITVISYGRLTAGSRYKVYVDFNIYDQDLKVYIESEPSQPSVELLSTTTQRSISITGIDTYDGDTTVEPTTIYRDIYLAEKTSGADSYGEPFYVATLEDNTTTTYTIKDPTTSAITPPSASELDQLTNDHMIFDSGGTGRYLRQVDRNILRRNDPNGGTSATPNYFDIIDMDKIFISPALASGATTAQRTLVYYGYRRPHEVFYDVDRSVDLPIVFKKALIEGVTWKAYEYRDRSGKESKLDNYNEFVNEALNKIRRQKGKPKSIRDVNGDTFGYEVT